MWYDLLSVVLLISTTQAQSSNVEGNYDLEMIEFMDMVPDPDGPIDFILRSSFQEEPDDLLATLEADEYKDAEHCEWNKCDNDLSKPSGIGRFLDLAFLKKIFHNLNPFANANHRMFFYLFRRESPECGRQLDFNNKRKWQHAGFNSSLPTRIIIHGWMSQSRGSFNRDVKNEYLKRGDYNVIVVDWSSTSANINYFSVVKTIEEFGAQLAQFTRQLNRRFGASFDDMYLIGHSLGAQIAGSAGKRIKPEQYNTIFALDPAGPKFRHRSPEFRIDPSDAKYVESMHTSGNFGFLGPTGSATFYPNYGLYQRNCFYLGCSHIRAYQMFAESINSPEGFWGTPCTRDSGKWQCDQTHRQAYQMGGEPSIEKKGIYYVKTSSGEPFALGRR
ncbi:phospholipase A1 2 isoform X1 [Drosophila innubila]|uniref:phospholipase A1 2 isoform X1 n=1 Tax=Drosophila innubila TaxID=198719 RepID=UPI00148DC002|nr:phospholipase A1 2 isoform X1 [Drosophila innubila]